jgi:hypothetical protein
MAVPRSKTSIPSQPVQLLSFSPDAPQAQDGAVQDAFNMFPISRGFRTFPGQRVLGAALPSPCFGSFSGLLVATPIFAAATANGLYVANSAGSLAPSLLGFANTVNRWRFAAYGTPTATPAYQDLLATDGVDPVQRYQLSTLGWSPLPNGFIDNSPPPLASIVASSDYALILVLPNSQTFVSTFNETPPSWIGSVPNQVYYQPISQSPGNITAAGRLRNTMVFYKANAIHVAYFAGGTTGWSVQDSSIQYGVLNQEWVINTGDYHYFPTVTHDFWQFDGWNLTRLSNQMAEFFRQDHNDAYMYLMAGVYDSIRELLIWTYSSMQADPPGTLDTWLIYYLRTGNWSFQRLPIDLPMVYLNPSDSHFYPGYFGLDHAPRIYDDELAPGRSYITSNYFGDYLSLWQSVRIRPGFSLLPKGGASCTPISQYVAGTLWGPQGDMAAQVGAISEPLSADGWFNLQHTDRLTSYQIVMNGLAEIVELQPQLIYAGEQ